MLIIFLAYSQNMPTHAECANYENGKCKLYNINVDPEGPACPNYQPKILGSTYWQQVVPAIPTARRGQFRWRWGWKIRR